MNKRTLGVNYTRFQCYEQRRPLGHARNTESGPRVIYSQCALVHTRVRVLYRVRILYQVRNA